MPAGGESIHDTLLAIRPSRPSARTRASVASLPARPGAAPKAKIAVASANAAGRHAKARTLGPNDANIEDTGADEPGTDEPSYHFRAVLATNSTAFRGGAPECDGDEGSPQLSWRRANVSRRESRHINELGAYFEGTRCARLAPR